MSKVNYAKVMDLFHGVEAQLPQMFVEISEHCHNTPPLKAHLFTTITSYYENGKVYETSHQATPFTKIPHLLTEAEKYNWVVSVDEETQTLRLERHYPSKMYRIVTYVPYDKDLVWITSEETADGKIVHFDFDENN